MSQSTPYFPPSVPGPTTPAPAGPASQAPSGTDYTPAPAGYRRPRGFLIVDGKMIALTRLSTTSASHFVPDSWTAELCLDDQPQGFSRLQWDRLDPTTNVSVCWGMFAKGQAANEFPKKGNYTESILGPVDDIDMDLGKGTVTLTGRDRTAELVDNKTSSHYLNQTASEAVTQIAKQFGFTNNRITKTTTPIGKLMNEQYSSMTDATPYWDFITSLAQQENFDAYVNGNSLYFGPVEADADQQPWVFYLNSDGRGRLWGNVYEMDLHRSATLGKDLSVTVITHDSKTGRSFAAYASRTGTRAPTSSRSSNAESVQSYVIRKPGLTPIQAQNLANNTLAEISKFERGFTVSLEGDPGFSVRKQVKILGTGSSFDTSYYLRSVSRSWSAEEGFTMQVSGKNVPTASGEADDDG